MSGERVIVRGYLQRPLVRRVWEVKDGRVLITDDPYFDRLRSGLPSPLPIGFSPDDVFCYDAVRFAEMERDYAAQKKITWEGLKRFL